ncbi:MAG: flagellar biosynthesis protein FlhA [Oceanicoccus sp.]|jgi:flagellar biosynthesis protein FlhA
MNVSDNFSQNTSLAGMRSLLKGNLGVPFLLLTILGMMTLPVPPFLLDVFFSFNIALAIVVLLVAVYAMRPLDFAVFPTVLLVATLLRLALNVASTRVVLLEGHNGGDAAGKVIQSFGEVVIGGNYAVGLVVFLILIIINFVVVTKGAGRISEVSARFTLDAMPGKQMAIDADLNSGLVDQEEAKARREDIAHEADFYGSMDGASKFVRGDAIAGIMILFINIIGGLAIGMVQHDLEFSRAMEVYSLLTIGDGLVAQIPGLLLSTSAAIMVTRVNTSKDMGEQITSQMFDSPKALMMTASILGFMGIIPGMPHFAFLSLASVAGALAYMISQRNKEQKSEKIAETNAQQVEAQQVQAQQAKVPEIGWDDVQPVDSIGLEVGYRLIPMVDKAQGGQLLSRIKGIRKKLSQEVGFLIPSVHIRDNLDLMPTAYRISLMGVTAGEAEIYPDRDMAINPGQVFGRLDGIATKDPAFGLEAVWIDPNNKDQAQTLGYTVVDASTVVATHINQLLLKHTHELLGHDEVQHMLDMLAKHAPKLVEQLVPETVAMNVLLTVLKNLLVEGVPIRDMRTIAEAISANAMASQDPAALTASVRVALRRIIVQNIYGSEAVLPAIALDPAMEQLLLKSVQQAQQSGITDDIVLEPGLAEKLQAALVEAAQKQEMAGKSAVLLVSAPLRSVLVKFIRYSAVDMQVLSYAEIPDDKQITIESTVG